MDERQYDLAIMRTLGASRGRVCAMLLLESLLLAAAGAIVGVALGHALLALIGAWLPAASSLAGGAGRGFPRGIGGGWPPAWGRCMGGLLPARAERCPAASRTPRRQ